MFQNMFSFSGTSTTSNIYIIFILYYLYYIIYIITLVLVPVTQTIFFLSIFENVSHRI